ncbi:MAG: hypothetical protein ISS69_17460 [Phycisphaerae bacterium]|nr:hypothetical protein [Phycisphaerae bacterium]
MPRTKRLHGRRVFHTSLGSVLHGDSLKVLPSRIAPESVDLVVTSPPFGLVRKKDYGNVDAEDYVAWFEPFGKEFLRILKPSGSLVIGIGGAWISGQPTRGHSQVGFAAELVITQKHIWNMGMGSDRGTVV